MMTHLFVYLMHAVEFLPIDDSVSALLSGTSQMSMSA